MLCKLESSIDTKTINFISAIEQWWEKVEDALANQITDEAELRNLGTNGFKVRRRIIDAALSNKRGQITQAAAEVIKQWGLNYDDKEKAFDDLCEILQNIQRRAWIAELKKIKKWRIILVAN